MNPKIEKLEKEIDKTKTRIAEMQARLRDLEKQKTELENTDYVAIAVLADRFVLSLINKKIVTGKNFTKKENGAVLMDDEIRKKFLTEWQKKKKETITHPYLNEKIEWGMIPYVQSMLLARYLRGDLDSYPVFLWK